MDTPGDESRRTWIVILVRTFDETAPDAYAVLRRWRRKGNVAMDLARVESEDTISVAAERSDEEEMRWMDLLEMDEDVYSVESTKKFRLLNAMEWSVGQSGVSELASNVTTPLWWRGITGEGHFAGIADSGIDYDSCFFRNLDGPWTLPLNRCDPKQRKISCYFQYASPTAKPGDEIRQGGHGTHTSGTFAGLHYVTSSSGSPSWDELLSSREFENGHAPGAKIVFHDIGLPSGQLALPVDFSNDQFFQQAYDEGKARVHSNSWGCGEVSLSLCFGYDPQTRSIDKFLWNNQDFLVVFAAGNDGRSAPQGTGKSSETSAMIREIPSKSRSLCPLKIIVSLPATAKNVLSVGATGSSSAIDLIPTFSARGPNYDGRVKPDLVFPGVQIRSADSSGNPNDSQGQSCVGSLPSSGISVKSGTSMSCPGIAGLAVLVRHYYFDYDPISGSRDTTRGPLSDGKGPSAALIKATIISSCRSLDNPSLSALPETRKFFEGFGRPNLDNVLNFEDNNLSLFPFDRHQLESNETHEFVFRVKQGGAVKATLVWTDPPGPVAVRGDSTSALVNDLDLIWSCSTGTNATCPFVSQSSSSRLDNVEQVPVGSDLVVFPDEATLAIAVRGVDVSMGPQPYSLVVSGIGLELLDSPEQNWIPPWTDRSVLSTSPNLSFIITIAVGAVAGVILIAGVVTVVVVLVKRNRPSNEGQEAATNPI